MSVQSQIRAWLRELETSPESAARAAQVRAGVAVGLSGGADSLALVHGLLRCGVKVHAVVVDHQLQEGSAQVARQAADTALSLGATAEIRTVEVEGPGEGPARQARYEALGAAAAGRPLLVAHTADDDAEGMLIGLVRGSGAEAIAGMRSVHTDHAAVAAGAAWLGRPLLNCTRADTEAECRAAGLSWWEDPHNFSDAYLRSRIRTHVLPYLQDVLAEHIGANMARTARMLREDVELLDELAGRELQAAEEGASLNCTELQQQPAALRRRVLKQWLADKAGPLTSAHLNAIDALVIAWKGQGGAAVPWPQNQPAYTEQRRTHRLVVQRRYGYLQLATVPRS
ncbi:tRNA(Ile)-lysidine synthetase [Corynebacterium sp. HMSC08A12]|uniref:tRNA lysidine(34) synthetase TilS n=1 Tax=Corynebacterium sp. HMSC08A12 TaxID=1581134 RepID=UPI0008A56347|nr:tRNA lysidine(34) synthetase TilS [Corynebacterium sp. HMSC08A12]OFT36588.1 tRNA(Ile)-lysidine synthetase [Corynebacterium sp. HMSC08A12]